MFFLVWLFVLVVFVVMFFRVLFVVMVVLFFSRICSGRRCCVFGVYVCIIAVGCCRCKFVVILWCVVGVVCVRVMGMLVCVLVYGCELFDLCR